MALKWVYENIENFSGNKYEILLTGESAGELNTNEKKQKISWILMKFIETGGTSVHYHVLNLESRKYFNRAYLASGVALDYFALHEPDHLGRLYEFSKTQDKKQLIKYLKSTDSQILAECYSTLDFGNVLVSLPWVPTIESPLTKGAFLTKTPEEILNSNEAPVMDILFSFTSEVFTHR